MANASQPNVINRNEIVEAAYGIIGGSQSGVGIGSNVGQRRRQLLSIDSNNIQKKRLFSSDTVTDGMAPPGDINTQSHASPLNKARGGPGLASGG